MKYYVERVDSTRVVQYWQAKGISAEDVVGYMYYGGYWANLVAADTDIFMRTLELLCSVSLLSHDEFNSMSESEMIHAWVEHIKAKFYETASSAAAEKPLQNSEILELVQYYGNFDSDPLAYYGSLTSDPAWAIYWSQFLKWASRLSDHEIVRLKLNGRDECPELQIFYPKDICTPSAALAILAANAKLDFLLVDGKLIADWRRKVVAEDLFGVAAKTLHLLDHCDTETEYKQLLALVLQCKPADIDIPSNWRDRSQRKKYDPAMVWKCL